MLEAVGMEIVSEIVSSEVLREIGGGGANNRPDAGVSMRLW